MDYPMCAIGTYNGAISASTDLLPILKTNNNKLDRLLGFTLITDKESTIKFSEDSSCKTMPYGSNFAINIDINITSIDTMVFDTACNILYLNYYYV
jgi:hypothetical protein